MMGAIAHMLQSLYERNSQDGQIASTAVTAAIAVVIRFVCAVTSSRMEYLSSKAVKKTLREMIYRKLLRLVCVPMIPVTIILIQRWAKKLLAKYWGQHTALGDTFLENLQPYLRISTIMTCRIGWYSTKAGDVIAFLSASFSGQNVQHGGTVVMYSDPFFICALINKKISTIQSNRIVLIHYS